MDSKQLKPAYDMFFKQSDAGVHFINKLHSFIEAQHELAEKYPVDARDYTQKARGIREIISYIETMTADIKTKSPTEKRGR